MSDNLRLAALGLAALVILVVAGLMFGQRYLVYSDDGLRLELPFGKEEEQKPLDPGDISVVIRPAGSQSEQPGQSVEEVPEEAVFAACRLPLSAVLDGTAADELKRLGATALILDMKDEEGKLAWKSEQTLAAQLGMNAVGEGINEALAQWNEGEVYTVARVCCFRDNFLPYQRNDLALRASYGNWRDELGLRWLNPDSEGARTYLAKLCGELAKLGFDEILLECPAFPTLGNRESIVQSGSYTTGDFSATVRAFLDQVNRELEPYDTALAIRVGEDVLTGADVISGLTAAMLEDGADRLWMSGDGEQLLGLLEKAGIQEGDKRLVTVVDTIPETPDSPCALLN